MKKKLSIVLSIFFLFVSLLFHFREKDYSTDEVFAKAKEKLHYFLDIYEKTDLQIINQKYVFVANKIDELPKNVDNIIVEDDSIKTRVNSGSMIEIDLFAVVTFKSGETIMKYEFIVSFYSTQGRIYESKINDPEHWIIGWSPK